MQLKDLSVFHLSKSKCLVSSLAASPASSLFFRELPDVFHLETCQRWVWVTRRGVQISEIEGLEKLEGREAYLFLLRFTAGLESKILGETDVFGQVKEAWRLASTQGGQAWLDFSPGSQKLLQRLFQWLFEDTKEIRTSFLQNLGGTSYGSLVRKLLRRSSNSEADITKPILLMGAGQMAQSLAPFLVSGDVLEKGPDLWVWNRSAENLRILSEKMKTQGISPRSWSALPAPEVRGAESECAAWENAAHVVVCIPMDPEKDPQRIEWFSRNKKAGRSIVHLGGMRAAASQWKDLPGFFALDDLFAMQATLKGTRALQLSHAEKACEERATLRSRGMSLSTSHCWEDLACFA